MADIGIPLSRTKIIVPTLRPEILHRPRLLEFFDDLLDKKLIIVAAPAGYGKTTLLMDFARQSEMPVCWLSLDPLDKDPQRFLSYFVAAIAEKFHKFGKQSKAALRSLTNLEQDTERLLSILVNEIDTQIDEHFALVVDDYQYVDVVPYIRDFFSRFVYLAGENCHVVLASRRLPSLPDITLMVARQQVGGFDLEQLAFRQDEIRALFEKNYGIDLTDTNVQELLRQTEGWITGLHLSTSKSTHGILDLTYAARATGVDLAAYLDQQVLAPQAPEVRKFLLETSLLGEFDAELCETVLGKGNWKHLMKTVRQNNLFALPVGAGGKWLRYHHLFQEFLQERIRQEDPQTARAIILCLADVHEQRLEWEKTYAIYKQVNDTESLADLVERAGIHMLLNERLITYQGWLDELPSFLLQERPLLLSHKGALLCALGEGRLARGVLDQSIGEFRKRGDISNLAMTLVRRAAAYRLLGDYSHALADAKEAFYAAEDKADMRATLAEAQRFIGVNLGLQGRIPEAIPYQENALRLYDQLGEKQSLVRVRVELGASYRAVGDYEGALRMYKQALLEWRGEANYQLQASGYNNLGVLYHYRGEYEQAVRAFESGLESARQNGSRVQEALLLASLGDVYTDLDEYESAGEAYENALKAAQEVNYQFLINYLNLAQAHLIRLCGNLKKAHQALDKTEPLIRASNSNHEFGTYYLERGCLCVMEESPEQAETNLLKSLEYFQRGDFVEDVAWTRIWLAALKVKTGDPAAARIHLQAALSARLPEANLTPLNQTIRRARQWLSTMRQDGEVGHLLAPWLDNIAAAERRLPTLRKHLRRLLVTVPIQAPHLSIQAFGKGRVRVDGKMLTSAQWKTAAVRELFFYFLYVTHPVTKEEVGAIFWPELDTKQLKLRFKNNLYRLRHALGQDVIVFEDEHYRFNHLLDYEYDIESFTAHLKKSKTSVDPGEKIANLHEAVILRNGPYLEDLDADWIWPERERLEQACMTAMQNLADLQSQAGDKDGALSTCREALKIDGCREDFHRLVMQIHADLGNRLGVIWQYQNCRDVLRTELGIAPSKETEALYQRLAA
ncbi:MAG TPA: tetratricopeptide repeat protein [Anaerolineales bacterium]|nr:tetratricopeptide repeat protein [Anaerolineales bacterium]